MITQRDAFWDEIYKLAKDDKDIIVVSADMGAPSLDRFRRDFPHQFVNTGIAEQNAILIASGLAKEGKKVLVYAIASFLTLNCIEKIRVQNAMMKIPITLVGVGAGFSYPDSGPTHHLIEDISIMRSLPNITTYSVADQHFAKFLGKNFQKISCTPNYIRLERQVLGEIYGEKQIKIDSGISEMRDGKETLIVSTGGMTTKMGTIIDQMSDNSKFGLVDIYKFPFDTKELASIAKNYKKIVTVEEGLLSGGLGSSILEALSDNEVMLPVKRLGIPLEDGYTYQYGGREQLQQQYGLGEEQLIETLKSL